MPPIGVTQTFDEKVSPRTLEDYLFISTATPENEAAATARGYTGVGHEINFVSLGPWLIHIFPFSDQNSGHYSGKDACASRLERSSS
jgi:hypothetical protein